MARAGGTNLIMNIGEDATRKKRFDSFGLIMLADAVSMAHDIRDGNTTRKLGSGMD